MLDPEGLPPRPLLWAEGLGYRFPDGVWAFRGIDFSAAAGSITVLAGRNGAGKTFFAKQLAGLLEPTEGTVTVAGQNMKVAGGPELVGYVFQDARLQIVGETVFEDLLFGPTNLGMERELALSRAQSALEACGLSELRESFIHRLSGGELRRLAIAGVLALGPRVLILDEPFANLDLEGVKAVLRIAGEVSSGGTAIIIVTHEIEKVLGLARNFAILDEGRLVLSGKPSEVLSQGIESFGLRDPFHPLRGVEDLTWLD